MSLLYGSNGKLTGSLSMFDELAGMFARGQSLLNEAAGIFTGGLTKYSV